MIDQWFRQDLKSILQRVVTTACNDDKIPFLIAPLQKKKMIPYEVLNAGQLKKYLNADW